MRRIPCTAGVVGLTVLGRDLEPRPVLDVPFDN